MPEACTFHILSSPLLVCSHPTRRVCTVAQAEHCGSEPLTDFSNKPVADEMFYNHRQRQHTLRSVTYDPLQGSSVSFSFIFKSSFSFPPNFCVAFTVRGAMKACVQQTNACNRSAAHLRHFV
jgi:hypothetical protein